MDDLQALYLRYDGEIPTAEMARALCPAPRPRRLAHLRTSQAFFRTEVNCTLAALTKQRLLLAAGTQSADTTAELVASLATHLSWAMGEWRRCNRSIWLMLQQERRNA